MTYGEIWGGSCKLSQTPYPMRWGWPCFDGFKMVQTRWHCDWWCLMMSPCKECDYSCWCLNHWTQVSQGTPRKRGQSGQGSCGFNSWPSTTSKTNESRICCQEVLQWYGPVQDISTEDEKAHLFLAVLTLTVDHDVMQQPLIVIKKMPLLHSCWASSSTRRMGKTCTSLTSFPRRAARSWDWRTRNSSNLSYFFHFSLNLRQFPIVSYSLLLLLPTPSFRDRSQRSCFQEVRPFYTMPDPTDEKWTNAYDVGRLGAGDEMERSGSPTWYVTSTWWWWWMSEVANGNVVTMMWLNELQQHVYLTISKHTYMYCMFFKLYAQYVF